VSKLDQWKRELGVGGARMVRLSQYNCGYDFQTLSQQEWHTLG